MHFSCVNWMGVDLVEMMMLLHLASSDGSFIFVKAGRLLLLALTLQRSEGPIVLTLLEQW